MYNFQSSHIFWPVTLVVNTQTTYNLKLKVIKITRERDISHLWPTLVSLNISIINYFWLLETWKAFHIESWPLCELVTESSNKYISKSNLITRINMNNTLRPKPGNKLTTNSRLGQCIFSVESIERVPFVQEFLYALKK